MLNSVKIVLFISILLPAVALATPVRSAAPDASPVPVNTAECDYNVAQSVQVMWKGKWYDAQILKVKDDCSQYYIHYTGWSDSWDEWVTPDRIK